ncbi:MAG TPA: hypothetical protein VGK89_11575 [Candidatus Eisenbacteria bacterium]|jgi:hypothetical protein
MEEVRARVGPDVFAPGAGVDVDAVLEHAFGVVPDFVDLPEGLLGRTHFAADGQFTVEVSRVLSERAEHDHVARRRLRSTLGHECGHGAYHAHLHLADEKTLSLFGDSTTPRAARILCRHESVDAVSAGARPRYNGHWWEYQANRGMAALLLPRRHFADRVSTACATRGVATVEAVVRTGEGEPLVRALADVFDVNPVMVLYRLQDLGYLPRDVSQEVLSLTD